MPRGWLRHPKTIEDLRNRCEITIDGHWYLKDRKANVRGYPIIGSELGHRLAWRLNFGEIPYGKHVLHKLECNGGSGRNGCISPYHCYLGSHKENMRDITRAGKRLGVKHWMSKYEDGFVYQVRYMREMGLSSLILSSVLNIPASTIRKITNGNSWNHIPFPKMSAIL